MTEEWVGSRGMRSGWGVRGMTEEWVRSRGYDRGVGGEEGV